MFEYYSKLELNGCEYPEVYSLLVDIHLSYLFFTHYEFYLWISMDRNFFTSLPSS